MKKLLIIMGVVAILSPTVVLAQAQKQPVGVQQRDRDMVAEPEGETVRNQGEDSQIQVTTEENEQTSRENMSRVTEKVEGLLAEGINGEVGEQIKQVAQAQKQAQAKIGEQLNKLEAKKGFIRTLFGPDFEAIGNLNQQMEQNRLRIQELQQLATKVQNQADETQIKEAVESLIGQNTALQNQVRAEEGNLGIFGWVWKLFNK